MNNPILQRLKSADDACRTNQKRKMARSSTKPDELIRQLINPEKSEEERITHINEAMTWILKELKTFKTQDQILMKQFKLLRSEINSLKEEGPDGTGGRIRRSSLLEMSSGLDKEFDGVQECNMSPFDSGEAVGMRRRAFSSVERVRKFSGRKLSSDGLDSTRGTMNVILANDEGGEGD